MKFFLHFLFCTGFAAAIAGCDRGNSTVASAPVTEVRLGFFPNVTHAQAVLGVVSGDFAKAVAPAKFTAQQFNAGPRLIEALNDHVIDVGYVGPGPAINAFGQSHGEGIRVISGAADNGVLIVAGKDSGVTKMADLKGRKIATPQIGNTQDIAARHYVTAVLDQLDTANVLPIDNTEQIALMERGDIDAAWVPEPWGSMLITEAGAVLVGQEKDLWPGKEFALTVIVTTPEFLAHHADVIRKLLVVNHEWTNRLNTNPDACISKLDDGLASLTGRRLPAGVVADSIAHVKFTEDPSPATFTANAQWAFDLNLTRRKTDLAGLIVMPK